MDYWTQSLDDGYPVDIINLDFRKVFDSVPHNRLLMKLKAYGIGGSLRWVQNFLSDRRQQVVRLMVTTLAGPQSLAGFPKVQSLAPCSFCYVLILFHYLWTAQSYYLLMMPRSFDQLDVKLITYNFNGTLIYCLNGQKPGCLISILASVLHLGLTHS